MTAVCPDWAALVREREQAERNPDIGRVAADARWQEALRHRDDCESCRRSSLRVDPLLLFSSPAFDAGSRPDATEEVDEIRRRVRLELDGRATEKRLNAARSSRRRIPAASMLAAGAAAAALGLSLFLWPEATPPANDVQSAEANLPAHIAMAPLVEPLGDQPMQVFQLPGTGPGADVVLVVTEVAP